LNIKIKHPNQVVDLLHKNLINHPHNHINKVEPILMSLNNRAVNLTQGQLLDKVKRIVHQMTLVV